MNEIYNNGWISDKEKVQRLADSDGTTPGNHRRFSLEELKKLFSGLPNKESRDEKNVPDV